MHELVAIDLPQDQKIFDTIKSIWGNGDAIFVLDRRFNEDLKAKTLNSVKPRYLLNSDGLHKLDDSIPIAENDALIMSTSGTTGYPKTVIHSFDSLLNHAEMVNRHLNVEPNQDKWIACLPLSHIGGLGVVIRSLLEDIPVAITDTINEPTLATLNKDGYNLISLVASVLDRVKSDSYKAIVLGGMAGPKNLKKNIHLTYGLTETGGGIVYNGTCLKGVSVKIQPETQLIEIKSPTLLRGYRSKWDQSTNKYVISTCGIDPALKDGYFVTSDCGRIKDDNLEILGRKDDLINTGGEKIWAKTLEDLIVNIQGVTEAAVLGIPDEKWGQKIAAAIVKVDSLSLTGEDITKAVKSELPNWAIPKEIKFIKELPKTALGKNDRAAILKLFS